MARILTSSSPATGHVLPPVLGFGELAARYQVADLRVRAAAHDRTKVIA